MGNYSGDVKKSTENTKNTEKCGCFVVKKIINENFLCLLCFPWIDKNAVPIFWKAE
ncbi:hypothetical protein CRENPOLYSF2_1190002 [Crenothrix polyspora]|uniref:Uncharacterized protein n=1 Tax=Crenothrix polyspora TaxID=360316 RepID=A0A1R4H0C6_9GAMM|nr:hypothetical protein CRENPOLYSF2_1190002 [Crenothrix polyspora]